MVLGFWEWEFSIWVVDFGEKLVGCNLGSIGSIGGLFG